MTKFNLNKLLKDKFNRSVLIAFIIVILISALDILFMKSGLFAKTLSDYMNGNYADGLWNMFKVIALTMMISFGILYYFLIRQDKSEALAVVFVSYITWRFGLADLFFFWLQKKPVVDTLTWLQGNYPIQSVANMFTNGIVTSTTLYISVTVGILISLGTAWVLKNKM